ncbi:MAG: T9SS type A sorting domain-containing protein [Flavobacteriales bacterium]|nr:T9SS type A sorting domain-containing protein [Flavobacteriales bacterium]
MEALAHGRFHCVVPKGGNPVYQARSLYSLVDDQAEFDDALLCIAAGYVVKSMDEPELSVTVYPNPNRTGQQFFEIKGLLDEEAMITVHLIDAQGRQLLDQRLTGTKGSLDVSGLAQGLYTWVVFIDGRQMNQGKVTLF